MATFLTLSISSFISAVPFLLLGCVVSGILEVYFPFENFARLIPDRPVISILAGALAGLFLPVGEVGVWPVTRRLVSKGFPSSFAMAFLFAAPSVNLVAMASTYAAFGLGFLFWSRLGVSWLIAMVVGGIFSLEKDAGHIFQVTSAGLEEQPSPGTGPRLPHVPGEGGRRLTRLATIIADEFFSYGSWLVLGILISALVRTVIPGLFEPLRAASPLVLCVKMAGLSFLYSSNAMEIAFTALGFAGNVTAGGLLVFLVLGPMVNLKDVLLALKILRPRPLLLASLVVALIVMIMGVSAVYLIG